MNKLMPLLKIQMMGFFNINKIKYSGNKREKRTAIFSLIGVILLIILMETYLIGLVLGWSYLGLTESIPALLLLVNVIVCFILTFMKSNGALFGFRDYDLLISLPISSKQLIASRLIPSYLLNIFFSIFSFFFPMIIFWTRGYFSVTSLLMTILALIVLSIVPTIAAMLIGLVTAIIASRFRYTNLVTVIISMLFLLSLMLVSFSIRSIDIKQLTQLGKLVDESIQKFYPLAAWLNDGIVYKNWLSFSAFFVTSLVTGTLFIFILSKFYLTFNSRLLSNQKNKVFQWRALKKNSQLLALYKREWRLYLSSPIYVINTLFGSAMLIAFSVALLFIPLSQFEMMLSVPNLKEVIQPYLPLFPVALSFFLVIGTTTSSSISIEGKNYWQLSVLPVKLKVIYQAKLLLNLTIVLPAIIISGSCFSLIFDIGGLHLLFLFIMPLAYSLFAEALGLLMDCSYAKFDWTNVQQVVKQSFANILTSVVNFISVLLGLVVIMTFPTNPLVILSIWLLLLLVSAHLLYRKIINKNPFLFE
ncbi:hypothetical protein [Enterococcus rivorum]|uniref:Uncharacterized protein n=1 Tax=Enterococcus rivorum TaxID=762845 RepID=A0A1E5KU86_9ENTE|nr:hypothetical protein [Enterococcus rivorum]MBP2100644.1 ABC-2 type transport system permease protein [Enterococcus rivorum]OEH81318.1 hypothetical protein BCR26_17015 [Enterococcus rivorum]